MRFETGFYGFITDYLTTQTNHTLEVLVYIKCEWNFPAYHGFQLCFQFLDLDERAMGNFVFTYDDGYMKVRISLLYYGV